MNARVTLAGALCFCILHGAAGPLSAQNKELPTATVTGEIKEIKQGVFLVGEGEQQYIVAIARDAKKVDVTGDSDVSALSSGLYVRLLEVKWDKKGNIQENIKKLELFTFNKETAPIGVDESGSLVAGRIASYAPRGGKISVVTERSTAKGSEKLTIKGTVAKDATVSVGLRGIEGLRLVKPGDTMTAFGKVGQAPMAKSPGRLLAEEVELKLTKPLAGAELDKPSTKKKTEKSKEKAKDKE